MQAQVQNWENSKAYNRKNRKDELNPLYLNQYKQVYTSIK